MRKTVEELLDEAFTKAGCLVLNPGEPIPKNWNGSGKRKSRKRLSASGKNSTRAKSAGKKPAPKRVAKRRG